MDRSLVVLGIGGALAMTVVFGLIMAQGWFTHGVLADRFGDTGLRRDLAPAPAAAPHVEEEPLRVQGAWYPEREESSNTDLILVVAAGGAGAVFLGAAFVVLWSLRPPPGESPPE